MTKPRTNDTKAPFRLERERIRDAMQRLLGGDPIHSDGKLTITSLATEAQVKRWLLTHRHTDLQDEFRARVARQGTTTPEVAALTTERDALKARANELASQLRLERATINRLERVINVLTLQSGLVQGGERPRLVPVTPLDS